MKLALVVFVACGLASGCATTKEVHPLTRRASFDFQCPNDQLRYFAIDSRSHGVIGCDKRATYVQTCQGQGWNEECTWVLNGSVESTARPSASGPPGQTN